MQFRSLTEHRDTDRQAHLSRDRRTGRVRARAIIIERTSAGLKAAKARGVQLGRKPSLTPAQVKHARKLIDGAENLRAVGVDRSTLYRNFAKLAR